MAWTNIFDLAEWDVWVLFQGSNLDPSPNSFDFLVKADEIDPTVGTVTVVDGVIVCDFGPEDTPGLTIRAVVMPVGTSPESALARVTATKDGSPILASEGGASFASVLSMDETFPGSQQYASSPGDVSVSEVAGFPITAWESGEAIPSGQGLIVATQTGGGV